MMRWVYVNHARETHFFGNPTPLANPSKPSSSSLLSSFQESMCKFSLKRWISAPGGIYESEMLLKGKRSQSLCINRPAAEPQGGESGRKLLVAEAPNLPAATYFHCLPTTPNKPAHTSVTVPTVIFRKRAFLSPSWHFCEIAEIIHWITELKEMI